MNKKEKIRQIALNTVKIEKDTIDKLKNAINDDFVKIILSIFHSKGRIVITGIGKSALVAQKIVATLNSTGTPALFMHAADAVHGDLGMITENDIVVCISKSGETAEIKALVPLLKNYGNLLIGMVARKDSFLGKNADLILHTPVPKEADPNNLAPTASTTAQMVLGDAMAISLLALKGFSPEHFALFHPGGALGKQLYLRVKDIFPQNEKPAVFKEDSIEHTIMEITSKRLGMTVVLDKGESILGIITDGDLRRMLKQHKNISTLKAKDIMTKNPKTIHKDELAVNALQLMRKNEITQLIAVDHERYLGVIHLHDLIKEGLF